MSDLETLKHELLDSCRILAGKGCVREITGHVSARIRGTQDMLVRCRPPNDPGVEFTTVNDIKRVSIDGYSDELGKHQLPGEFPIHSEIYRQRPEVGAVVHGHPHASLMCGIMNLPFRPIVGGYDPGALEIALTRVPVFPRSVLISTDDLAREMLQVMGTQQVCLLRGHGIVISGESVADATVRAVKFETMAHITMQSHMIGGQPFELSNADIEQTMSKWTPIAARLVGWTWDFYRRTVGLHKD